jgi:ribosomal protein S18 acetylase RimI-like enzyme
VTVNNEIVLVAFDPTFTGELLPMWRASFENGIGILDPNPIEGLKQYFLGEVVPTNDVRVAWRGSEIIGFVAATPESVSHLYVRIGCQRAGLGTRMLDWAKAQSNGSLWLYTFAQNTRACAFYERNGFRDVAHGFAEPWPGAQRLEDVRFEWTATDGSSS